jgi:hypothetical protein
MPYQGLSSGLDVFCIVSSGNGFLSPASFSMLAKVTRGFRVAGVKVSPYEAAVFFALAVCRSTLKNMYAATLDILDRWHRLEEYINGQVPFF